MPEQEEIDQQLQLLHIHRRTLASQLQRLAKLGGLAYAPPEVVNGIAEARENIARIKKTLRHWGVASDDHPDDEPGSAGNRPPVFFLPNNLPTGYVERLGALMALRQALLSRHTAVGVVATTTLHGLGGLGKTVLARAICDDEAIRATFPDGVLWATLGQSAESARHQRDWVRALGGDVTTASSLEGGKVELARLLTDRAMLLVLDDVWDAGDAEWLRAGGPRCATLITTRDATQAEGAALVELELMQPSESCALLEAAGASQLDPPLADTIAARLGHLPLALKIVGVLLKRIAWTDIAEALDEGDLAYLDHGQSSVLAAIKASLDRLPAEWVMRYHELAIFPQDEPLSEAAVARLWAQTAGLKPRQARRLLADLRERALIQADNALHDLQYDYLRAQVPPAERRRLHSALADALSDPATATPPPDDTYSWRRLAYHLARGERNDDLRGLLHNGAYLQGKIAQLGTTSLLEDFRLLPRDEEIERIAEALRLGAHIMDQEPRELENQIVGRIGPLLGLHNVPDDGRWRFRLESQTLMASGGPLLRTLVAHTDEVNACVFGPDGRLALSASGDGTLRVWDVASGQPVRVLEGHTDIVYSCAFNLDGRLALSASGDGTLRVWDVASGQPVRVLEGHAGGVYGCAFSLDGRLALSASGDSTLRVWDVASGQPVRVLEGHLRGVYGCAFSPDGRLALSASGDSTLRVWDVASSQPVRVLEGHRGRVRCCAFSPDGQLALSASDDKTLRMWEVTSGESVRVLEGHQGRVRCCAFNPDGRMVLSASSDWTLRIWDVASDESVRVLEGHTGWVYGCVFSPDGRLVLSASNDGTLQIRDMISAQSIHVLEGHAGGVYGCAFSPDGRLALSASGDGTLRVWDVASSQSVCVLEGHTDIVYSCAFSPDGRLALSTSGDGTLRMWDVASGQSVCVLEGHIARVSGCAFSPDGRLGLSASHDNTLRLWDVATGSEIACWHADAPLYCCTFHPDGRRVIAGDSLGNLHWLRIEGI
jgi:WD40 repeat protein